MPAHLIIGNTEDYHAVAIQWAMGRLGERALIWDGIGGDNEGRISIGPTKAAPTIELGGELHANFRSVWFRRAVKHKPIRDAASYLHAFIETESRHAHLNLSIIVANLGDFIVCGEGLARASSKAWQLQVATDIGFKVPATLITNDYDRVCKFVKAQGVIAVKPFSPHYWHEVDRGRYRVASTSVLDDPTVLDRQAVEICPTIYQKFVNKRHELRVTVIGRRIFVARIAKLNGGAFTDWRFHIGTGEERLQVDVLPAHLERKVLELLNELGLQYGCIDLVVDQNGDIYFLEINPSGQFLFVEQEVPELPLLNAFSSMLRTCSVAYSCDNKNNITVTEFESSEAYQAMANARGNLRAAVSMYTEVI